MSKTVLTISAMLGIVVLYFLVLIFTTMIVVKLWGNVDPDDIDYAMAANVIQFFVIVVLIAEKVGQWMI